MDTGVNVKGIKPVAMAVFQQEHHVFVNQAYCTLLGYNSLYELRSKRLEEVVAPDSINPFMETLQRCLEDEHRAPPLIMQLLRSDGTMAIVECRAERSAFDDQPALQAFFEEHEADAPEPLRTAEGLFAQVFANSDAAMLIAEPASGHILEANQSAANFYGHSIEQLKALRIFDISALPPRDAACLLGEMAEGTVSRSAEQHCTASGELRNVEVFSSPIDIDQRRLVQLTIVDHSARFASEQELRSSEEHYRRLVETSSDIVFSLDEDGAWSFVNEAARSIYGLAPDHLIGSSIWERSAPECADADRAMIDRVARGESVFRHKTRHLRRDGSIVALSINIVPIVTDSGFGGMTGTATDVTEEERAKQAHEESERSYRSLFQTAGDSIFVTSLSGVIISYNVMAEEVLLYDGEELHGQNIAAIEHSQFARHMETLVVKARLQGTAFFETQFKRKDNTLLDAEVTMRIAEWKQEPSLLIFVRDVSARKRTEAALRQTEINHRALLDSIRSPVVALNDELKVQYCNEAFAEFLRRDGEELRMMLLYELFPDFAGSEAYSAILSVLEDGQSRVVEGEADGYIYNATIYRTPLGIIAIFEDVTDRRFVDMALKEYRKHLEQVIEERTAEINEINRRLKVELEQRQSIEAELRTAHDELEVRVRERTQDLEEANESLRREFDERGKAETALRESEERYRELVQNTGEGITVVDENEVFVFANPAADQMFGVERGGLVGRSFAEFTSAEQFSMLKEKTEERRRGISETYEMNIRTSTGEARYHQISVNPYFDEAGKYIGAHTISVDITGRVIAEEALRQSEERFRRLVELSPVGIFVYVEGRIVFINSAGAAMFGATSTDELIGRQVMDFVHPDFRERVAERTRAIIEEQREAPLVTERFVRVDGSEIDVEVGAIPMTYQGQQSVQVVARDITERVRLQEQLFQQQKEESIITLAGGVAHDFNNILIGVLGSASLLRDSLHPADPGIELCDTIRVAAERMTDLTTKLLAYARGAKHDPQPLHINHALEDALIMLRGNLLPSVSVERQLDPQAWPVYADRGQLNQVFINLIINANEAMYEKGGHLRLSTANEQHSHPWRAPDQQAMQAGDFVHITVSDSGTGMSEETRARVFEPFFSTKFRGRGLGLAAAKGIIRNHGGAIYVESEVGYGATFHLILPRSAEEPQEQPEVAHPRHAEGAKVLIVDDEALILKVASKILSSYGYQVLTAIDAEQGLEVFAEHMDDLDLVIVDLQMPGVGGWEMLRQVREMRADIKVALCSGYDENSVVDRANQDQIDGFIKKPYDSKTLSSRVQELLGR